MSNQSQTKNLPKIMVKPLKNKLLENNTKQKIFYISNLGLRTSQQSSIYNLTPMLNKMSKDVFAETVKIQLTQPSQSLNEQDYINAQNKISSSTTQNKLPCKIIVDIDQLNPKCILTLTEYLNLISSETTFILLSISTEKGIQELQMFSQALLDKSVPASQIILIPTVVSTLPTIPFPNLPENSGIKIYPCICSTNSKTINTDQSTSQYIQTLAYNIINTSLEEWFSLISGTDLQQILSELLYLPPEPVQYTDCSRESLPNVPVIKLRSLETSKNNSQKLLSSNIIVQQYERGKSLMQGQNYDSSEDIINQKCLRDLEMLLYCYNNPADVGCLTWLIENMDILKSKVYNTTLSEPSTYNYKPYAISSNAIAVLVQQIKLLMQNAQISSDCDAKNIPTQSTAWYNFLSCVIKDISTVNKKKPAEVINLVLEKFKTAKIVQNISNNLTKALSTTLSQLRSEKSIASLKREPLKDIPEKDGQDILEMKMIYLKVTGSVINSAFISIQQCIPELMLSSITAEFQKMQSVISNYNDLANKYITNPEFLQIFSTLSPMYLAYYNQHMSSVSAMTQSIQFITIASQNNTSTQNIPYIFKDFRKTPSNLQPEVILLYIHGDIPLEHYLISDLNPIPLSLFRVAQSKYIPFMLMGKYDPKDMSDRVNSGKTLYTLSEINYYIREAFQTFFEERNWDYRKTSFIMTAFCSGGYYTLQLSASLNIRINTLILIDPVADLCIPTIESIAKQPVLNQICENNPWNKYSNITYQYYPYYIVGFTPSLSIYYIDTQWIDNAIENSVSQEVLSVHPKSSVENVKQRMLQADVPKTMLLNLEPCAQVLLYANKFTAERAPSQIAIIEQLFPDYPITFIEEVYPNAQYGYGFTLQPKFLNLFNTYITEETSAPTIQV